MQTPRNNTKYKKILYGKTGNPVLLLYIISLF